MTQINTTGLSVIVCGIILSLMFAYIAQRKVQYANKTAKDNSTYKRNIRFSKIMMALSCIAMWLPSALRYNVGIDNDNYILQFHGTTKLADAFSYYEPGFGLLCYVIKERFNDYQILLFVTAMLTGSLMWRSIYKYSNNFLLCIIGYMAVNMYFMSYTVIRQFIAVAILTNSVDSIKDKQLWKFILIWLCAVSFHYTALVFIVLYFIYSPNDTKLFTKKNCTILLCALVFLYYFDSLMGGMYMALSSLREGYATYEASDQTKGIREILFIFPLLLYAFFFRKDLNRLEISNSVLTYVVEMFLLTKIISLMSPALSRIHYYFVFAGPILMSYSTKLPSKPARIFTPIAITIYYLWSIRAIFKYQWEDFLPYYTIFER